MKQKYVWTVLACLIALPGFGQIQRLCQYGVLPIENVTMLEAYPAVTAIDDSGGISSSQLVIKTYHTINKHYNWGLEVPLTRYESPEKSVNGLGDVLANVSWMNPPENNKMGYGAKMEFFLPTATDKLLGSGQFQASPSVFVWWQFNSGIFVAAGYKHYVSVIGDHAREDINTGRFRVNLSYLNPNNWWIQTNWYYYQDFHHSGRMEFVPELEVGTLVSQGTGIYINGSTHAAGNWHSKDWTLGVGFKILYL